MLYHLSNFINKNNIPESYSANYESTYLHHFLKQGHFGVELFFVISGFILAVPFIKVYSQKKGEIKLKKYFKRRLTRLEPPYFIIMIALFFLTVWGTKTLTFGEGLKSLGCSLLYIHNFVYGLDVLPLLNGVAWSLEIEVQFYLLAPLLATIFLLENKIIRRAIIIGTGFLFAILGNEIKLPFISLFNYIEFFAIGFLLADLYLHKSEKKHKPSLLKSFISLSLVYLIFELESHHGQYITYVSDFSQLILMFALFYGVLFLNALPAMRFRFITNIGGMCYTIYLLNTYVISLSGGIITRFKPTNNFWLDYSIYTILILGALLVVSSIFFILIERPCMDKDWYKKLSVNIFKSK